VLRTAFSLHDPCPMFFFCFDLCFQLLKRTYYFFVTGVYTRQCEKGKEQIPLPGPMISVAWTPFTKCKLQGPVMVNRSFKFFHFWIDAGAIFDISSIKNQERFINMCCGKAKSYSMAPALLAGNSPTWLSQNF